MKRKTKLRGFTQVRVSATYHEPSGSRNLKMAMQYLFRKPIFPVICDIEGELIAAVSLNDFENKLKDFKLKPNHIYSTIDSNVDGWFLNIEPLTVSPLAIKKKWSKNNLINLYNKSKNSKIDNNIYCENSISNKKSEAVFSEIVELLDEN